MLWATQHNVNISILTDLIPDTVIIKKDKDKRDKEERDKDIEELMHAVNRQFTIHISVTSPGYCLCFSDQSSTPTLTLLVYL